MKSNSLMPHYLKMFKLFLVELLTIRAGLYIKQDHLLNKKMVIPK